MVDANKDALYKDAVKKKMYKLYFLRLHSSEKNLKYTSTKIVVADILKKFKATGKHHILDAGCGDGLFVEAAAKLGFDAEGFDSNKELLQNCKLRSLNVKYGDFSKKLPYEDETFDAIYCSNVFEHLYEPEFALYELVRILKKNGMLIISVPEANNVIFYNDWTHVTPFTSQTFENLMMCLDNCKSYKIYKRHFPVLVRFWQNPLIQVGNWIIKKGIFAEIFTYFFEKLGYVHRHDIILEIRK